jgi:hypothetical protein
VLGVAAQHLVMIHHVPSASARLRVDLVHGCLVLLQLHLHLLRHLHTQVYSRASGTPQLQHSNKNCCILLLPVSAACAMLH